MANDLLPKSHSDSADCHSPKDAKSISAFDPSAEGTATGSEATLGNQVQQPQHCTTRPLSSYQTSVSLSGLFVLASQPCILTQWELSLPGGDTKCLRPRS